MTVLHVEANKRGRWWVLQGVEHPSAFSQVRRLGEAADAAREALSFVSGIPAAEIDVVVTPNLPQTFTVERRQAELARDQAAAANREAAVHARAAARALARDGYTMRDIGDLLGVSHQRAAQLAAA